MADEDVSGDDKQQHYSRVASVLKDRLQNGGALRRDGDSSALMEVLILAAKEFGIESEDQGRIKQVEKRCQHSCSDHVQTMNPKLWESLPRELLQPVFGHLPLDVICRMQFLNKEWQRTITADPDFHRLCNEVYPNMVCIISKYFCSTFWVRVFDINTAKWHSYKLDAGHPPVHWVENFAQMNFECEDGGLVCFVTRSNMDMRRKRDRSAFFFHVVNPLTRVSKELPPLFDMRQLQLLQMSVDKRTGAFQVVIVARRNVWTNSSRGWISGELAALLYDSLTGEWRPSPCDTNVVLLRKHFVYDFAKEQLIAIDYYNFMSSFAMTARYKESVFILKSGSEGPANEELATESPTFYIEEYRLESTNWVKAKSHRCNPFEHPPKANFSLKLYACKGFLLVLGELDSHDWCKKKLAWLYDLSTSQWKALEFPPRDDENFKGSELWSWMQIFWVYKHMDMAWVVGWCGEQTDLPMCISKEVLEALIFSAMGK